MEKNDFPESLYKAFNKDSYREEFLSEKFRMGTLKGYRNIEDACRRDCSEGEAKYKYTDIVTRIHTKPDSKDYLVTEAPGLMASISSLSNSVYLFCTSMLNINLDDMKNKFGKYIVEITDPFSLAKNINAYFSESNHQLSNNIRGHQVQYNKNEIVKAELSVSESMYLSYTQKPPSFRPEAEFRYVAVLSREEIQCQHIDVNFNHPINYAKPI